jgi:hypothetical protein
VTPPSQNVHWLFATGFLVLGACLIAQVLVGDDAWNRSNWRRYFFPGFGLVMGVGMWPVAVLAHGSTIHLLAHLTWAHVMMLAGAAHLGLAHGKLRHRVWPLTMPLALGVSGLAFLGHEEHGWLYSRSALIHHVCGWTLVIGALFPLGASFRPRSPFFRLGFAATFVVLAVALFALRDTGPVLGNARTQGQNARPNAASVSPTARIRFSRYARLERARSSAG